MKKILVGGRWKDTGRALEVRSPYSGEVVDVTCLGGTEELREAVDRAQDAFEALRGLPAYKRAEVLSRVVSLLREREEEFARTIALECGKPIRDARVEVRRAQNTFQIALEETKRMDGEVISLDVIAGSEKRLGIVRRFPIGVVLGITPFNFPLNLVAHKVAPAMASSNPIIIKPASKTPLTALLLGEVVMEAGWVEGGMSVVPSKGQDAERLLDDERVRKLTFTGSADVGWRLQRRAGSRRVTLELGGNAGVVVHSDADMEFAVKRCVLGAFSYAGQICISIQRIYVERTVFDDFIDGFIKGTEGLRLGDPLDESTDVGPMIDEESLSRTAKWVDEATGDGAVLLTGGKRRGSIFEPTVLTSTKREMKVCCEEVFAPVVVVEPYENFDDALREINNSKYGLQAGVFTRDIGRIFHAFEVLEVGGVIANDIPTYRVDNMPYGGVKMSGFGREGVRYAIQEMTEIKLLALNLG